MRNFIFVLLGLVILFFLVRSIVGIVGKYKSFSNSQIFEKGYCLSNDSLYLFNINEQKDTVIGFKGIQVINFWATWCKPCLSEMPGLEKMKANYPQITMSLISFEEIELQKQIIAFQNIKLPAYKLNDTTIFKKPEIFPRTVILKNGCVVRDIYTARDWQSKEITDLLDSLLVQE
jgi:thiol-disulfide isomerase/thioredoxin